MAHPSMGFRVILADAALRMILTDAALLGFGSWKPTMAMMTGRDICRSHPRWLAI